MIPWYYNQTLTTFTKKTNRLNCFDQSLVTNFFSDVKTFFAAPFVPINLDTCAVIDLCCDLLWDGQINRIGICTWVRVLFTPLRASVRPPFLRRYPSKNEVLHVPIRPNRSTQHWLCPVYRRSQKSTHISSILEFYVRQVRRQNFPGCCIDNANEADSMLPRLFSSRH